MKNKTVWEQVCFVGSIMCVILGCVAFFIPNFIINFSSVVIGTSILLFGISMLYNGISQIDILILGVIKIFFGFICSIIGLIFLFNKNAPYQLFGLCFGLWLFSSGIIKVNMYNSLKSDGINSLHICIKGIASILFGLLMMFFPITATVFWTKIFGLYFLFLGGDLLIKTVKNKNNFF